MDNTSWSNGVWFSRGHRPTLFCMMYWGFMMTGDSDTCVVHGLEGAFKDLAWRWMCTCNVLYLDEVHVFVGYTGTP